MSAVLQLWSNVCCSGKGVLQTYFLKGKEGFTPDDNGYQDNRSNEKAQAQSEEKIVKNGLSEHTFDVETSPSRVNKESESTKISIISSNMDDGMPGIHIA
ncbi:guanylate cyclase 2G [Biomphalaria glabrata]|nr:guanylate cyclase 2G [Biomphalaria glabrata]